MPSAGSAAAAPPTEQLAPTRTRPHVVLLASPGAGHLLPLAELAQRLVEHHGFAATFVTFTNRADPKLLSHVPASVATAALPAVQIDDLPADAHFGLVVLELTRRSLPSLRALLRSVAPPLAALVPDFFCSAALPVAAELGVPGYVFVPCNLTWVALMRHVLELHDGAGPGEYRDLPEPLELPGGMSLQRADLPEPYRDCNGPAYPLLVDWGRRNRGTDGFLVNTFRAMEPAAAEAFEVAAEQGSFPPVFLVGPFVRSPDSDEFPDASSSPCLEWLDRQPAGSVVYVSFGSSGALSVEQTAEVAAGLEASGHRFLWVVRMPSLDGRHFAMGTRYGNDDEDPLLAAWLPEGFAERTRDRGLAVAAWAPQVRVLSHPATAAFVTHCGWNSALESVKHGVPMVSWPMFAEQRMNALLLEGNLGVALRARAQEGGGVVTGEELAAAVKELMEGEKGRAVRARARDLQQTVERALGAAEGSSHRALEEVGAKWKAVLGRER